MLGLLALAAAVTLLAGVGGVGARPQGAPQQVTTTPSIACHGRPITPKLPQNLPTAPDPSLLAILGVLRRPQVPADIPSTSPFPAPFLAGIEVGYERLLATTPDGQRYFLIPGFLRPPSVPTNCMPPLSPQQRHQQQLIAQQLRSHPRFTFWIAQMGRNGVGGSGGGAPATAAAINAGLDTSGGFGISGGSAQYETEYGTINGLVPDGVASVTLRYRRRADRTLAVTNNFFVLTVHRRIKRLAVHHTPQGVPVPPVVPSPFPTPSGAIGAIAPIEIAWRDAQGSVIKTIRQPAYCAGEHGATQRRCLRDLAQAR